MLTSLLLAAAAGTATPAEPSKVSPTVVTEVPNVQASAAEKPGADELESKETASAERETAEPAIDPMQAMAAMSAIFDKIFPAGPEPEPARLAGAREVTMTMLPKGAYAEAINGFVNQTVDRVLDMSEADFATMFPAKATDKKGGKATKRKPPSTEPLRLMLAKKEPNFDAKLAAVRAFAGTMFVKLGEVAEPKFRESMARSLARKFDAGQLAEIRTFLATPTGAAYGRDMVGLWFQPEVMRGTFQMMPDMMKLLPSMMGDVAAFDKQMKALGKPAPKAKTK